MSIKQEIKEELAYLLYATYYQEDMTVVDNATERILKIVLDKPVRNLLH